MSIPANITQEFKKKVAVYEVCFLCTAQGFLEECRYYLILSKYLYFDDMLR
ncbi:hypothetical protein [Nostoc sp. MG11]|uniref:hypothetical protein n=1 Tax=Nostoc sp. MG11 TaxID=2721166 RepID=UPI0039B6EE07